MCYHVTFPFSDGRSPPNGRPQRWRQLRAAAPSASQRPVTTPDLSVGRCNVGTESRVRSRIIWHQKERKISQRRRHKKKTKLSFCPSILFPRLSVVLHFSPLSLISSRKTHRKPKAYGVTKTIIPPPHYRLHYPSSICLSSKVFGDFFFFVHSFSPFSLVLACIHHIFWSAVWSLLQPGACLVISTETTFLL